MATIIFDFDDTLFETHKLKDSIFETMNTWGLPHQTILETYEKSIKKFLHYTPENHLLTINEMTEFNIPDHRISEIKNLDFSFYQGQVTKKILSNLAKNNTLILLTLGDQNFQEFKIAKSGLAPYFHKIQIVPAQKEKFLLAQNYQGQVFFINDKKIENDLIRKMFPHFQVIDFHIKTGSLKRLPVIKL